MQPNLNSPDRILRKALEKETQAHEFYAGIAAGCTVEIVRKLAETLEAEEARHIRMIRDMMARFSVGRGPA